MCDRLFEPVHWAAFRDFVRRVHNRADATVAPSGPWRGAEAAALGVRAGGAAEDAAGVEVDAQEAIAGGGGGSGALQLA